MAFIPDPKYIVKGDVVFSTKELSVPTGKFTIGHEFIVTEKWDSQHDGLGYRIRCVEGRGEVAASPSDISKTKPYVGASTGNFYDR